MEYEWPGNVRELENVIQRAVVMSAKEEITADDLRIKDRPPRQEFSGGSLPPYDQAKKRALGSFQRQYISAMLERTGGNVSRAARLSGITRAAFYSIMKKNGFKRDKGWRRGA